jgi:hypothetical protein
VRPERATWEEGGRMAFIDVWRAGQYARTADEDKSRNRTSGKLVYMWVKGLAGVGGQRGV